MNIQEKLDNYVEWFFLAACVAFFAVCITVFVDMICYKEDTVTAIGKLWRVLRRNTHSGTTK